MGLRPVPSRSACTRVTFNFTLLHLYRLSELCRQIGVMYWKRYELRFVIITSCNRHPCHKRNSKPLPSSTGISTEQITLITSVAEEDPNGGRCGSLTCRVYLQKVYAQRHRSEPQEDRDATN